MAVYGQITQFYPISQAGYTYNNNSAGATYQVSSLFSFTDSEGTPLFIADMHSVRVNGADGGQWYLNFYRENGSIILAQAVDRLPYSDGNTLVFRANGSYDYIINDVPLDHSQPVSVASDAGKPGTYTVAVNELPTGVAAQGGSLATTEDPANGTVVGTVVGLDPDSPENFTYTLLSNPGGAFAINAAGVVTVANGLLLDYEQNSTFTIRVRVTDGFGASAESDLNISLSDVANEDVTGDGSANTFVGGSGADILRGAGGNDNLIGGGGADTLNGGAGSDTLVGGLGDDTYVINLQTDSIFEISGQGSDLVQTYTDLRVAESIERIEILGSATTIVTFDALTTIYGNELNNVVLAGEGVDSVYGSGGQDSLYGEGGDDVLLGGDAADFLLGGIGSDNLDGGAQADYLQGDDGADFLYGGADGDFLYGNAGIDFLRGQDGADRLTGGSDGDQLLGDAGNDALFGEAGADYLEGGDDADTLFGGDDNDTMSGGAGGDLLSGDAGNDVMEGGADGDTLYGDIGADTMRGGTGGDGLYGQDGADVLFGDDGNDVLSGGESEDIIRGGLGADTLYGGTGADRFAYNVVADSPIGATDVIGDFQTGLDKLDLRLLYTGPSSRVTTAVFGSDTYVYVDQTSDGTLDFAVVLQNATLVASDIRFAPGSAPSEPEAAIPLNDAEDAPVLVFDAVVLGHEPWLI